MTGDRKTVLYVDDDIDLLDSMKLVLEAKGFAVETAASAEEGLRAFRRRAPDLVIVDLMMEEIDAGTSLIRELRLAGNRAPVFMLSSVGDQLHQSVDTAALGLSGVFQKPVSFDALLKAIRQQLG